MPYLKLRLPSIVLAALATGAFVAANIAPPAPAAAKPSIRGVALDTRNFIPVAAIVFGASQVVICISGKCLTAFGDPLHPERWAHRGVTGLRKGQVRDVIVFAASATGEVSFLVRNVTVR